MNDNLYNYLNGVGGSVKQLDNGVYKVKTNNWTLYINPNSSKDVNLVVYYPGLGGMNSTAIRGLTDRMTSANPDNHVAILSQSENDPKNVLEVATKILNDNGYTISSLVTSSNSASGGLGIRRTADYLTTHPELIDSTVILSNDGYSLTNVGKNAQLLIDNQVPIVLLAPDYSVNKRGSNRVRTVTEQFANQGFNVFQMETKDDNHGVICTYSYVNGVPEYILGIQDELGTQGVKRAPDYVLYKYNTQTKQYEPADMKDIQIASSFKDVATNIVDPSTYKNITYKLDTSVGVSNNSTLASDLNVVMDAMNELSNSVKNSSYDKVQNSCSSTTKIPAVFYDSQNYLLGVSSTLADNIGKESAVIANIAQAIYNMDVNLAKRASSLNDTVMAQRVSNTLKELLSTDITIPYTSFASPINFEKTTQGKAGKLCMSDIKALLSGGKLTGSLANRFETDNSDTQKVMDSIKSFQEKITSNTTLQGDIWKEVNSKLDSYNSLLDKRLKSNDKLKAAIEEALKLLEDYMGDYDELDDSMIDQLKEEVSKFESQISDLQNKIEAATGNASSEVSKFKSQIDKNRELIEELKKKLEKLEGLWEVINKATDIVSGAVEEIKSDYTQGVQNVAVAAPEKIPDGTNNTPIDNTNTDNSNNYNNYNNNSYNDSGYTGGNHNSYYSGDTTPSQSVQPNNTQNNTIPWTPAEQNQPEQSEQQPEQTIINNYYYNKKSSGGGGGISHSEEPAIIPTDEAPVEEPVVEELPVEEPIIEEVVEEPIVEEAVEEEIIEPEEIVVIDDPQVVETAPTKKGSPLKAVGLLAGAGIAAGAAAYAYNEYKKTNDESEDEEDYDYGYDSSDGY